MTKFIWYFAPFAVLFLALERPNAPKTMLSEYGFFVGELSKLQAANGVYPYDVNAPLFSDYAEKSRFIYIPEGKTMQYDSAKAFQFPTGAVIIKTFFYYHNAASPERGKRILETRLLLKDEKGWKALAYIWNEQQTDAQLEVAGASIPVSWHNKAQKKQQLTYMVPNQNQCKGCHSYDGQFTPLGTTARQLNTEIAGQNQLLAWSKAGILALPDSFLSEKAPRLTPYLKDNAPVTDAARAYLDGNCAHCHNPHGPAATSGMFLGVEEQHPERLGIGKPPVAAGRGSGGYKYGIVPGKPEQSILVYRMESNDPGVRMPEIGRQMAHEEGIALIKKWINALGD